MQATINRRSAAIAAAVATLAIGAGVAYATIPSSSGVYSACLAPAGTIRLIDTEAGQTCRKMETAISWSKPSQPAQLVCPSGTIMSTGVCIETAARAAASHPDAESDCADEGRRLPSPGELNTARRLSEIDLTDGSWTDDLGDITGTFKYLVITENGNGVAEAFDSVPYRCVAAATLG